MTNITETKRTTPPLPNSQDLTHYPYRKLEDKSSSSLSSAKETCCCGIFHFVYTKILHPLFSWIKQNIFCISIPNFEKISPSFYIGEKPNRQGLEKLKENSIRTIVHLGEQDLDPELAQNKDFDLFSIPFDPENPSIDSVLQFLDIAKDSDNLPLLIYDSDTENCKFFCSVARMVFENERAIELTDSPKLNAFLMDLNVKALQVDLVKPVQFRKVSDYIFQGGALSFSNLTVLNNLNFRNILGFQYDSDLMNRADALNLYYSFIEFHPQNPTADIIKFLKTIHDSATDREPIYICNPPNFFKALIRVFCENWSQADALKELQDSGDELSPIFAQLDLNAIERQYKEMNRAILKETISHQICKALLELD